MVLDLSIIKFNSATFVNVKQWSVDIPFDQSRLRGIDMTFFVFNVLGLEFLEMDFELTRAFETSRPNSSVRRYFQNCVTPALPFLEQCESRTKGRILFSEISFSDV